MEGQVQHSPLDLVPPTTTTTAPLPSSHKTVNNTHVRPTHVWLCYQTRADWWEGGEGVPQHLDENPTTQDQVKGEGKSSSPGKSREGGVGVGTTTLGREPNHPGPSKGRGNARDCCPIRSTPGAPPRRAVN